MIGWLWLEERMRGKKVENFNGQRQGKAGTRDGKTQMEEYLQHSNHC
jgi:hypothetical protein